MNKVLKMHEHVELMLKEFELNYYPRRRGAFAIREADEVQFPPVRSTRSYAAALHEIGHMRGKHQSSKSVMVRERWAWRWAKQNALVWTQGMENTRRSGLAAYEAHPEWRIFRPTLYRLPNESAEDFSSRVKETLRKELKAKKRARQEYLESLSNERRARREAQEG